MLCRDLDKMRKKRALSIRSLNGACRLSENQARPAAIMVMKSKDPSRIARSRVRFLWGWGLVACVALCVAMPTTAEEERAGGWICLFNRSNLDGWTPKFSGHPVGENLDEIFRVEEGLLRVVYDPEAHPEWKGHFGHLFFKHEFSHYILRFEYRFTGSKVPDAPAWAFRNSGVVIHGQPPETMARDQDFPTGIEVQLLGGDGENPRATANVCTPGTHVHYRGDLDKRHCINSKSKTYHGDVWVEVEVEVRGHRVIRHKIEGETVLEYEWPVLTDETEIERRGHAELGSGTISLQAKGHPVDFRHIRLKPLPVSE